MIRYKTVPVFGLVLLLFAGCADSSQDEAANEVARSADELRTAMDEMRTDLQFTLDQFEQRIEALDQRYMNANAEIAADWEETRNGMAEYRQHLEADMARLETATEEEARQLKDAMADDLEQLSQRVERAHLESIDGGEEFVAASRDRLSRLEQDFRVLQVEADELPTEARMAAGETRQELSTRAEDLGHRLDELASATAEEIDDEREDIAEDISSLTASVERELFEMRQAFATGEN